MNVADVLAVAERWPVFPCNYKKEPLCGKGGFHNATKDAEQIKAWWQEYPAALTGMPTGKVTGVVVIDIDNKDGKNGSQELERLEAEFGKLPETPLAETMTGGFHHYFRYPDNVHSVKSTTDKIAKGVDSRADGGYAVIPPSPGYDWLVSPDDCDYAPLPQWLWKWLVILAPETPRPGGKVKHADTAMLESALKHLSPDDYETWVYVGMALQTVDGFDLWEQWSQQSDKYKPGDCKKKWSSFNPNGNGRAVDLSYVLDNAKRNGWNAPQIITQTDEAPRIPKAELCYQWVKQKFDGRLKYDEFATRHLIRSGDEWRPLTDDHDTFLVKSAAADGKSFSYEMMNRTVMMVAKEHTFHPVREFLDALEWDGEYRLNDLLCRYFGADDCDLHAAYSRKFIVSAVARIYEPGVKSDAMLVLEGGQGIGKSTACEIIGCGYFSDHLPPLKYGAKEAQQAIAGAWVVEIPELSALSKAEESAVKSFLSTTVDRYRPPYGRHLVERPRQTVFIGTTNEVGYLTDATGNRRFWCVECPRIDMPSLRRDIHQIIAEAVVAYRAKEPWHLSPDEEAQRHEANKLREEIDPWHEDVENYVELKTLVRQRDLMIDVLDIKAERADKRVAKRLTAIMHRLGFDGPKTIRLPDGAAKGFKREDGRR